MNPTQKGGTGTHTHTHPARDDLVRCKGGRGAAVVTRVELLAGRPVLGAAALVVAVARGVGERVAVAVPGTQYLVLEARGKGGDTLLRLVLGEEFFAERFVLGRATATADDRPEPGLGVGQRVSGTGQGTSVESTYPYTTKSSTSRCKGFC